MLDQEEQKLILALMDQVLLDRIQLILDKLEIQKHLNKQLLERITNNEQKLEKLENQDVSKA